LANLWTEIVKYLLKQKQIKIQEGGQNGIYDGGQRPYAVIKFTDQFASNLNWKCKRNFFK